MAYGSPGAASSRILRQRPGALHAGRNAGGPGDGREGGGAHAGGERRDHAPRVPATPEEPGEEGAREQQRDHDRDLREQAGPERLDSGEELRDTLGTLALEDEPAHRNGGEEHRQQARRHQREAPQPAPAVGDLAERPGDQHRHRREHLQHVHRALGGEMLKNSTVTTIQQSAKRQPRRSLAVARRQPSQRAPGRKKTQGRKSAGTVVR